MLSEFYKQRIQRGLVRRLNNLKIAQVAKKVARQSPSPAGAPIVFFKASTGIDDWEWGVTLWAKNPSYLKDIVYAMRFDESSAKYALFGPFYFGYILPPERLMKAIGL